MMLLGYRKTAHACDAHELITGVMPGIILHSFLL